ncbi:MAG: sulfatase-like hydrolase/transferase [Acidobacteria bacterium]|nr:sulfatase-like hydrolase/transferase [Acidobacteriota bacterium]
MTARCLLILSALWLVVSSLPAAGQPPNVILMFSDDQGTLDMAKLGARDLYTRNLDKLADRGILFTQFYAAAPVCSPSRAALLTGRYPRRAGVPGNVGLTAQGLPPEQVTIAEMLKQARYRTSIVGKWHLGHVNGRGPLDQGFDSFFGHKVGCIDNYSHFFYWSGPNKHDLWKGEKEHWEDGAYFPDLMMREARRFLEENKDGPFFLYLPFNIPHYPLQGLEKWRNMYSYYPSPRREYAALVSTLDEKVGEVVAMVDELGLRENTLIIFMSDHGHSTEERTMFGGGYAGPYRGAKFSLFEAGIRVPAIVSMPGTLPEGQVRGQLATGVDWLPTIAAITGAPLPGRAIDGKSLLPIIRSADAESPHEVFHWQTGEQWAVREGDWKLIVNPRDTNREVLVGDDATFLSNLNKDISERTNFASRHPDVAQRLTRLHDEWLSAAGTD